MLTVNLFRRSVDIRMIYSVRCCHFANTKFNNNAKSIKRRNAEVLAEQVCRTVNRNQYKTYDRVLSLDLKVERVAV